MLLLLGSLGVAASRAVVVLGCPTLLPVVSCPCPVGASQIRACAHREALLPSPREPREPPTPLLRPPFGALLTFRDAMKRGWSPLPKPSSTPACTHAASHFQVGITRAELRCSHAICTWRCPEGVSLLGRGEEERRRLAACVCARPPPWLPPLGAAAGGCWKQIEHKPLAAAAALGNGSRLCTTTRRDAPFD